MCIRDSARTGAGSRGGDGGGETGRFLWANSHDIFVIDGRLGGVYEWWEWYRVDLG